MTTPDAAVLAALARAEYRTSSYTSGNGECVMIGHAGGWVGIQDSKQCPRTTLPATATQFAALLVAVKSGHLR
jgi:hypothetical protein